MFNPCNSSTCITRLDNLGVLANKPEVDGLARSEVRATFVNDTGVNCRELVATMAQPKKNVNTG